MRFTPSSVTAEAVRRYLELFRLSKQYDFLRTPSAYAYGGIAYRDGGGVIVHDIVSDELLLFFV